jgi:hypothetical protein
MITMLNLFLPCYLSIFCLSLFFIFCDLALLALFISFVLSSVCNVAMVPVGIISIWNEKTVKGRGNGGLVTSVQL